MSYDFATAAHRQRARRFVSGNDHHDDRSRRWPSLGVGANFTVTVGADGKAIVTGPSLIQTLAVLNANTTGELKIYPVGASLPTPMPVTEPTPTPTATAGGLAVECTVGVTLRHTATPAPTASPAPKATATPAPTATPVAETTIELSPVGCTQFGNDSTSARFTPTVSGPPLAPGAEYAYGWIVPQDFTLTVMVEVDNGVPLAPGWLMRYLCDISGGGTVSFPGSGTFTAHGGMFGTEVYTSSSWQPTKSAPYDALDRNVTNFRWPVVCGSAALQCRLPRLLGTQPPQPSAS